MAGMPSPPPSKRPSINTATPRTGGSKKSPLSPAQRIKADRDLRQTDDGIEVASPLNELTPPKGRGLRAHMMNMPSKKVSQSKVLENLPQVSKTSFEMEAKLFQQVQKEFAQTQQKFLEIGDRQQAAKLKSVGTKKGKHSMMRQGIVTAPLEKIRHSPRIPRVAQSADDSGLTSGLTMKKMSVLPSISTSVESAAELPPPPQALPSITAQVEKMKTEKIEEAHLKQQVSGKQDAPYTGVPGGTRVDDAPGEAPDEQEANTGVPSGTRFEGVPGEAPAKQETPFTGIPGGARIDEAPGEAESSDGEAEEAGPALDGEQGEAEQEAEQNTRTIEEVHAMLPAEYTAVREMMELHQDLKKQMARTKEQITRLQGSPEGAEMVDLLLQQSSHMVSMMKDTMEQMQSYPEEIWAMYGAVEAYEQCWGNMQKLMRGESLSDAPEGVETVEEHEEALSDIYSHIIEVVASFLSLGNSQRTCDDGGPASQPEQGELVVQRTVESSDDEL